MTVVATPSPAATVVVVRATRPGPRSPFEVLLLRRSAAMSFVAGAHVFPGGRIDEADRLVAPAECCDGLETPPRFPHLDAERELACRVAAVRELVEEAGVLLARRGGSWATTEEATALRRGLDAGAGFERTVRDGGWRLALDALVPFARVVTPRSEPRRFDTHFFLAKLPDGREPSHGPAESDELVWATPAEALERGRSGDVVLLPPTWVTLALLGAFGSTKELLAWGRARTITRIEPVLTSASGRLLLSIPAAAGIPSEDEAAAAGTLHFSFEEGRGWRPDP